eukprot:15925311-Heterocapsa_arctica.AAC.1
MQRVRSWSRYAASEGWMTTVASCSWWTRAMPLASFWRLRSASSWCVMVRTFHTFWTVRRRFVISLFRRLMT